MEPPRGRALRIATAVLLIAAPGAARASETDNLTWRFVPLEDSAPKLNGMLNAYLNVIARKANEDLKARFGDAARASDVDVELAFVDTYRDLVLRKVEDRLIPVFEACIERNDCPGWPRFERIAPRRKESIYGEARYNGIAEAFLSSSIDLCGVRVGTDKTTHLLSNGFFYWNASRRKGSGIASERDAYEKALADEHGLMGAASTQVVSPADAHATAAGWRLAHDYFQGDDPVFARDAASGLLVRRRDVNVCSYVTPEMDEVLDPSAFTAGKAKVRRLQAAIAERLAANAYAKASLTADELRALHDELVRRPPDPRHDRISFGYRLTRAVKYAFVFVTMSKKVHEGVASMVFPDVNPRHRKPIALRREPPVTPGP